MWCVPRPCLDARRAAIAAAALGPAACAAVPPPGVPLSGAWGGPHIGMMIGATETQIDYDCARGEIRGPIVPARAGRFEVEGTHTPGQGGPDIQGQVLPTYRVRFSGAVRGEEMALTGRVENGVLLGPFTLRRGAEPGLFRCL